TYVTDPAFKATYEAYAEGLAKYIQTAINIWAEANLK
ncbi:MAG: TipAS antibiotic-recognition domain, partial [Actinomycetota bacterium]